MPWQPNGLDIHMLLCYKGDSELLEKYERPLSPHMLEEKHKEIQERDRLIEKYPLETFLQGTY